MAFTRFVLVGFAVGGVGGVGGRYGYVTTMALPATALAWQ
jgi:hypothetical protein